MVLASAICNAKANSPDYCYLCMRARVLCICFALSFSSAPSWTKGNSYTR